MQQLWKVRRVSMDDQLIWTITEPPASLNYHIEKIQAGTEFFRIHSDKFSALEFNPGFGNARFSPIRDANGNQIPTIYAATTIKGAMMESIFHDIPFGPGLKSFDINKINDSVISKVRTEVELKLVKLSAPASRKLGIPDAELIHSTANYYPQTRAWGEAIHKAAPESLGLQWVSRQDAGSHAIVLFGDRLLNENLTTLMESESIVDNQLFVYPLLELIEEMGVVLIK